MTTTIAIKGAAGRMGRCIASSATESGVAVKHLYEHAASKMLGQQDELTGLSFESADALKAALADKAFDVLIDFSPVASVLESAKLCAEHACPLVSGTTGWSEAERAELANAAGKTAIVFAPNMSIGVNLCFDLIRQVSEAIGAESDIEIIEAHHRHKKDAPSGTSLRIGQIIAESLGKSLDDCAVYGRQGTSERKDKEIGFQVMRIADAVGEHTALFALDGERIEITHRATDRASFARGALRAAIWVKDRPAGLYQMSDVLKT